MEVLQDSVKSLMKSNVISVPPGTRILSAIDIILDNNFSGVPVTDKDNTLVGILTKYDLIIKRGYIQDDSLVEDVMNKDPLFMYDNMTVEDAIRSFTEHHKVDPIPVVDQNRKLVGVISRFDMVKLFREYGIKDNSAENGGKQTNLVNKGKSKQLKWLIPATIIALGLIYYFFIY